MQVKWRYDATCYEALRLFHKEIARHDDEDFEFLAPDAHPTTKLKTMQTPRRYTFGRRPFSAVIGRDEPADRELGGSGLNPNPSCTVVVAMLDFASPGQLPEQPPGPFRPTDVASFGGLVDAGEEILIECVRARGVGILPDLHFGWMRAGKFFFHFGFHWMCVCIEDLADGNRRGWQHWSVFHGNKVDS